MIDLKPNIILFMILAVSSGCHHKPVYPEYGSIYISTDPPGAEVLMDGSMTHQITPVKMDGIPVGYHEFTLRYFNCKTESFSLEIKPGQTRMVYKELSPIRLLRKDTLGISAGDMDLIADKGEIYLTNLCGNNITVASMSEDGQISVKEQIDVGGPQRLIAVNSSANKVFFTKIKPDSEEEIVGMNLLSREIIQTIYLQDIKYYSTLILSPDDSILVAADSLNKKLVLIDTRLCSIIRTINAEGCPTDVSFDKNNPLQIYVTQSGTNQFALINLETGVIVNSISTGNSPGAIFWNNYSTGVGFCNRIDGTYTIVNVDNWSSATSAQDIYFTSTIIDACWSRDEYYVLWARYNVLGTMYMPNWFQTIKIYNNEGDIQFPLIKILLSIDKKYLLMLNKFQLVTVELDL